MFPSPGFAGILASSDGALDPPRKQLRIANRNGPVQEPIRAAQNAPAVLVETRGSSILEPRVYATGIDQLRPHLEYSGLIFMQHSPKFHPLLWAPCSN